MKRSLVALVLAACGDSQVVPDAAPPVDGATLRGLVAVQLLTDSNIGAVDVFFQNADSSLVLATHAHEDGTANAFMAEGGYVTVLARNLGQIWTFADVQLGAHLVIDQRSGGPVGPGMFVTVPAPPPSAAIVELSTPCESQGILAAPEPATIPIGNCNDDVDVLVVATNGGIASHYLYAPWVVAPANGTVVLPGPYLPVETSTVQVDHAPLPAISVVQALFGPHGRLLTRQAFEQPTDGSMTATLDLPRPPGTRIYTDASSLDFAGAPVQHVVTWDASAARTTIDLADRMSTRTSPPLFDPTSSTIAWTETADGARPNAVRAMLSTALGTWQLLAPRGSDPLIHVPVLPGLDPLGPGTFVDVTNFVVRGGFHAAPAGLVSWQSFLPFPIEGDSGHIIYDQNNGLGGIE